MLMFFIEMQYNRACLCNSSEFVVKTVSDSVWFAILDDSYDSAILEDLYALFDSTPPSGQFD